VLLCCTGGGVPVHRRRPSSHALHAERGSPASPWRSRFLALALRSQIHFDTEWKRHPSNLWHPHWQHSAGLVVWRASTLPRSSRLFVVRACPSSSLLGWLPGDVGRPRPGPRRPLTSREQQLRSECSDARSTSMTEPGSVGCGWHGCVLPCCTGRFIAWMCPLRGHLSPGNRAVESGVDLAGRHAGSGRGRRSAECRPGLLRWRSAWRRPKLRN